MKGKLKTMLNVNVVYTKESAFYSKINKFFFLKLAKLNYTFTILYKFTQKAKTMNIKFIPCITCNFISLITELIFLYTCIFVFGIENNIKLLSLFSKQNLFYGSFTRFKC